MLDLRSSARDCSYLVCWEETVSTITQITVRAIVCYVGRLHSEADDASLVKNIIQVFVLKGRNVPLELRVG